MSNEQKSITCGGQVWHHIQFPGLCDPTSEVEFVQVNGKWFVHDCSVKSNAIVKVTPTHNFTLYPGAVIDLARTIFYQVKELKSEGTQPRD